mmetsp:Transcript_2148/g.3718  ORF Transcript_2148/g.3718 Transcript_2148/m.3718 type:complete len:140 (+) Transcript_2148:145-564(+)
MNALLQLIVLLSTVAISSSQIDNNNDNNSDATTPKTPHRIENNNANDYATIENDDDRTTNENDDDDDAKDATTVDYGNHNQEWEDGPASWEEFGHDNEHCGVQYLTVEEWERGRHWDGSKPVIVRNVTAGWKALHHWKK